LQKNEVEIIDFFGSLKIEPDISPEEVAKSYKISDSLHQTEIKNLFFTLEMIMEELQQNNLYPFSDTLSAEQRQQKVKNIQNLGRLFSQVEILITELEVLPDERVGLFSTADDKEMIPKFKNLVNRIDSAFKQG
jgi:uncharacterized protein (DUF4213/DUF364 family)